MHSMMEGEGGSEPQDVFVELGTLITEGRVPGGGNARGYSEGPHCAPQAPGGTAMRHVCNPQNFMCKRAENFRKHMLLLFQNNVPMCIEVFLCADCTCGAQKAQSTEVGVGSPSSDLLLEQWTISVVNRHVEPSSMLARGLLQAVRSQLHFSQLSAWWSSSKGSRPSHVSYRVTVPGQVFASQFHRPPNEHTFPLATVGKNCAIQVCARSIPRMEAMPLVPCLLHSISATAPAPDTVDPGCVGKQGSSRPVVGPETNSSASVSAGVSLGGAGDPFLGESLLDPPPRLRSPPRAAEAPDHMFRRMPCEAAGARWQSEGPPSPPMGLPSRWRRWDGLCPGAANGANDQACSGAAPTSSWKQPPETINCRSLQGLLDDRMQTECNQPGKHHCSCEGEEEMENIEAPTQIRHRRRSQVSAPSVSASPQQTSSTASASSATSPTPSDDANRRIINESTKRSSGFAVMTDDYVMYSSESAGSSSSNTGSLKRRRPVVCDASEPNVAPAADVDCSGAAASSSGAGAVGPAHSVSPPKATTTPLRLKPPLSRWEFEEVLAVLRDRNKSQNRPAFQTPQTWFSTESPSKLKDMMGHSSKTSDSCVPLFSLSPTTDSVKKSHKSDLLMDAIFRSSTYHRYSGRGSQSRRLKHDLEDPVRTKQCDRVECNCDKKWSDNKCVMYCSESAKWCGNHFVVQERTRGKKPSYDLSEDHNNQAICDIHTSLQNSDIGDNYLCLSDVSQTKTSQTKEETKQQLHSDRKGKNHLCMNVANTPLSPRSIRARTRKVECSILPMITRCVTEEEQKDVHSGQPGRHFVPSASERARFRRSFDSAASMVFHTRTGLPLTSSPAPVRRGTSRFDYDSSLNSVSAIRSALFDTPMNGVQIDELSVSSDDAESESGARSPCSPDSGITFPALGPCHALAPCSSLLGSFEESVLNGRLEPVSTVHGFTAELGASGSFCPRHLKLPVTVFFYTLGDYDKVSTPYLGHINLGKKGYNVPRSGTIQVTLFNPMGTVIKMFVVMYDLTDMPANSHTFLRQRTLYMPVGLSEAEDLPENAQKWLRYLIHLRFFSSKSGRIYLHTDIRMIIFRKSDMDTATAHNNNNPDSGFELRSFTHGPGNPKFSPR